MALKIDSKLTSQKLVPAIERMFELSAQKILNIEKAWDSRIGAPVFTVKGRYIARGWTEWTQGFQFGSAILQFDATGDERFLDIGRGKTIELMASHVSHVGVHDHGFNNVSTYGNLLRLMHEDRIEWNDREKDFYELALKASGAVQAARWTKLAGSAGFIHSFNGAHSLFVDTIRSLRSLAVADRLGQDLRSEQERRVSLLDRLIQHAMLTANRSIYYGAGRDAYDIRGRVAHECIFNVASGSFRCPNSQQGFSPFSTWTRGLSWALCGFAEQLEFLATLGNADVPRVDPRWFDFPVPGLPKAIAKMTPLAKIQAAFRNAAFATADFYLAHSCADGVPMWDTGAPNLYQLPTNYLNKTSDPHNAHEPVDSSAAAIAAQGLIRLGNYLTKHETRNAKLAQQFRQAGLTIARTLLDEPYVSTAPKHQGLLLHSVYHRPNGWDYVAPGQKVPNGESSMWGDYHLRELALLILREARGGSYLTFFGCVPGAKRMQLSHRFP